MKYTTALTAALLLAGSAAFAQMGDMGAHFMEQWDMDSDGKVTLAEVTEMRGNIFAMFDTDSDGSLSAAEWQGVEAHMAEEMQSKGMGQGMGKRQAKGANGMQAMMMMFGKGHGGMMHEVDEPGLQRRRWRRCGDRGRIHRSQRKAVPDAGYQRRWCGDP
ncbi:MAG: hypothetical protein V9G14_06460 [Cypionkella sp.]